MWQIRNSNHEATAVHKEKQSFSDKMARYGLERESSESNPAAHSAMDSFTENDSGVGFYKCHKSEKLHFQRESTRSRNWNCNFLS